MQIPGSDIAEMARAHQESGGGGYQADDSWVNIVLEPGFRVWRGVGGPYSPYHIGPNTAGGVLPGHASAEFWRSAQVKRHITHGYRIALQEFEVLVETPAAHGLCSENWGHGWGGAEQYFIPGEFEGHLAATGRRIKLSR